MITLFVIGLVIFATKVALLGIKATWGITKALLFVLGIPVLLIVLLIIWLTYLAVPLLVAALLAVFIMPRFARK